MKKRTVVILVASLGIIAALVILCFFISLKPNDIRLLGTITDDSSDDSIILLKTTDNLETSFILNNEKASQFSNWFYETAEADEVPKNISKSTGTRANAASEDDESQRKAEQFSDWFNATPTPQNTSIGSPTVSADPSSLSKCDSISKYKGYYSVDSSSHKRDDSVPDLPSDAFDSNLLSAWCTDNNIKDEWIRVSVQDGVRYQVAGLRIAAGFWGTDYQFEMNCSPRTIDIYCDGEFTLRTVLARERDYQTIWLTQPVACSSITLIMRDGYQGPNKGDYDCCIAEIELLGPDGDKLVSSALSDWGKAVSLTEKHLMAGQHISRGDRGMEVLGLQLLLKNGFGVLSGPADGIFGAGTQEVVDLLADRMRKNLPTCEGMSAGVVDIAYWRNMLLYMDFNAR